MSPRWLCLSVLIALPLTAQTTYKFSGTVTTSGRAVANATIDISYPGNPNANFITTTGADGRFDSTVNAGNINLFVNPPAGETLLAEGMQLNITRNTSARFVLFPPVTIDVTGRSSVSFPERLTLYSLTTNRSYSQSTQDGHAIFTVVPDVYSVHASHADTSYYFGRTTVDARDGLSKSVVVQAEKDTPITATLPPRRALISVSAPDANGVATISGQTGACDSLASVAIVNANTHELLLTLSNADGSFSARMFAPPGSTLQIKHDPSGRYLPDMNLGGGTNIGISTPPGTFIDVAPAAGQFSAVSFVNIGTDSGNLRQREYEAIGSQDAGRSWVSGAMPERNWTTGQSLTLSGTLKIFSRSITDPTKVTINSSVSLERLFDSDGIQREEFMQFSSSFMTPTGFPIERNGFGTILGNPILSNMKIVDGHLEADWTLSATVPSTLPPGIYRPSLTMNIGGLAPDQRYYDVLPVAEGEPRGRVGWFPLVRIGSPKPPRLFWFLGLDTFSNGARGTVAVEDRSQAGITSHVMTNPAMMIVPMRDPRSGATLRYRLEPYVPLVQRTFARIAYTSRIPFKFPSGSLSVRITRPDNTIDDLGAVPFAQSMSHSATTRSGENPSNATSHVTDFMQLTTLDPRFDYAFTQYGLHRIEMKGSVEDVYGNVYQGGGTYEVYVARPIDLETGVIPGTPFEIANVFAPQVILQPPFAADVTIEVMHMPDSDPLRTQRWTIRGRANRFGFFTSSTPIRFDAPGEYRADVTANYIDDSGTHWMGVASWGNVVETPNSPLITHGRRGFDLTSDIQQPWFNVRQARKGGDHVMYPFHRGDIMWMQANDPAADIPKITIQDPQGSFAQRVVDRARLGLSVETPSLQERITIGEIPLFSTASTNALMGLIPEKAAHFGYFYGFAERPGVRVREVITEDLSQNAYWRFGENYHFQLGTGIGGDKQNDFKFQFGGAVWREADFKYYGAYASLFVLLPFDDEVGGRVFPPFQGSTGDPSGGPIMTLKGKAIDMFFHPTALRAGTVLQVGESVSIAGQIAPTLPAKVSIRITSPKGSIRTIAGQANKIGYYFDPSNAFIVDEPGVWKANVSVTFDGLTGSGAQVQAPYPTGDVLGSRNGEFNFYVVRSDAPSVGIGPMPQWTRPSQRPVDLIVTPPAGLTNTVLTWTTTMPGFILEEGTTNALQYTYDAQKLARDFPNLDLYDQDGIAGVDTITISLLVSGTDSEGLRQHFARQIVIQGEEVQMPEQKVIIEPPRRRGVRR